MIKPFFAKHKDLERNLLQDVATGSNVFQVASPSDFEVGDRLFISDSTGVEYVGAVVEVRATSLITAFPVIQAKEAGALMWRAAGVFQWPVPASDPLTRSFTEGLHVERSLGGEIWSVRVADETREDEIVFCGIGRAIFNQFRAWLALWVRGGVEDLTWVDENRSCACVRLLSTTLPQNESTPKSLSLRLRLAVLEEGGYA